MTLEFRNISFPCLRKGRKLFFGLLLILSFLPGWAGWSAEKTRPVDVFLKIFPFEYSLKINGEEVSPEITKPLEKKISVFPGNYVFTISAEGYTSRKLFIQADRTSFTVEEKLEKEDSFLRLFAEIASGSQPKSVEFTPDGSYLIVPLLDDNGIDVFSASSYKKILRMIPPENFAEKKGFVETAILPLHKEIWVSQMTTGCIHVFDLTTFDYLRSIPTLGEWTKVISINKDETRAYVSNWLSEDISIINIDTSEVEEKIKVDGTPRGLAFSGDGKFLYACMYDTGTLQKINLETKEIEKTINFRGGSKRHIVLDEKKNIFYVSDMYWGTIYVLNGENDTLIKEIKIDHNPNTICLSGDGKYLFISTRGPNHPETYLRKGPKFGKIYILDTESLEIAQWIWGKNQPTGIALSPDNRLLAFTDFRDACIEIYWTGLSIEE